MPKINEQANIKMRKKVFRRHDTEFEGHSQEAGNKSNLYLTVFNWEIHIYKIQAPYLQHHVRRNSREIVL